MRRHPKHNGLQQRLITSNLGVMWNSKPTTSDSHNRRFVLCLTPSSFRMYCSLGSIKKQAIETSCDSIGSKISSKASRGIRPYTTDFTLGTPRQNKISTVMQLPMQCVHSLRRHKMDIPLTSIPKQELETVNKPITLGFMSFPIRSLA